MKLLLDTHLLLWAASYTHLSPAAVSLLQDPSNELFFSSASIWEIAIKNNLERPDFKIDPGIFLRGLLDNDYQELAVTSRHGVVVNSLPLLHKDPFDRILLAQAIVEGITLVTKDTKILKYQGPIKKFP